MLARSRPPGMSVFRSLSDEERTLSKLRSQARSICALATPLSANSLPRSGLVQFIIYDVTSSQLACGVAWSGDANGRFISPCFIVKSLTTDAFASIFSEARNVSAHLCLANQCTHQVPELVRAAVLRNASSLIVLCVAAADADLLAPEFGLPPACFPNKRRLMPGSAAATPTTQVRKHVRA